MKNKYLIILLAMILLITGCQKKEEQKDMSSESTKTQTNEPTNESDTQEPTKETINENTSEPVKEETKQPTKEETKEPAKEETEEPAKKPEIACTSKKFSNTYSYVYETYDICRKKGNQAFLDITDNKNPNIFVYDCEEIVDECGKTWYGVIFYEYDYEKSTEVKKYY